MVRLREIETYALEGLLGVATLAGGVGDEQDLALELREVKVVATKILGRELEDRAELRLPLSSRAGVVAYV
jgi:hypothetical protein